MVFIWRQEYEVVHSSHLMTFPTKGGGQLASRNRFSSAPSFHIAKSKTSREHVQESTRHSEVGCQMIGHVTGNRGYCGDHSETLKCPLLIAGSTSLSRQVYAILTFGVPVSSTTFPSQRPIVDI